MVCSVCGREVYEWRGIVFRHVDNDTNVAEGVSTKAEWYAAMARAQA